MNLSRQHYEMIASVVRDPTLHLSDSKRLALASRFADKLAATNSRFDRQRFIDAATRES
jgi:hypothetical protein